MTKPPQFLHDLLDNAAEQSPLATALSTQDRVLSYGQLATATKRTAERLHQEGVSRGDRVVVTASDGLGVVLLVYAASRLGATFSVLHEEVRGGPLKHVLDDCEPRFLVADELEAEQTAIACGSGYLSMGDIVRAVLDTEASSEPDLPDPGTIAVDPVSLIYTSGTTSLPKAVVSTHQQVIFAVAAIQSCLRYRDDDVVYCPLPLSFDYGLYQVYLAASGGARLHLGTAAEAGPPLLRSLRAVGATILPGVPPISDRLAWLLRRSTATSSRLRLLTNTGAALSATTMSSLRAALPGLRIQVMYGLTECKRAAIMPPDADLEHPGSCGLPLPGTEVFVIDDDGNRLPSGEIGQFVVRGPNVMAGYWRRPELTEERFPRTEGLFPELRTGDYGWQDEDGFLYFSGRRDDLYKERGFRVSTTEVEAAARRVPGVVSAAVLPPEGKRASVLAVAADIAADDVRERMRDHIEPFKIPRHCVRLDGLPVSGNGKIDRKRLVALVVQQQAAHLARTD